MALGLGLGLGATLGINASFISTWKTDNTSTGSSNNNQVKLPLESTGTYNFVVDWGDEQKDHITAYDQAEVTHTYSSIGTYTIKIRGVINGFRFADTGDKLKLLTIERWGNLQIGNNESYFYGCSNLQLNAIDELKTTNIGTLKQAFRNCSSLNSYLNINTSNIFYLNVMFYGCTNFNQSVSNFNTSNVINMNYMFYNCTAFNQSVSNFNTSNVTDTQYMFYGCANFNQSVSNFNTSNVATMARMFYNCQSFNQSVSNFNTANVIDMNNMFYNCDNFNQSVSNFDTTLVTDMSEMFRACPVFNQDISTWNFTAVTNMTNMFTGATSWSTANYDAFLISAAGQAVQSGVQFDCSTKYTSGGAAEAARTYLIGTKSWTINDAGALELKVGL